MSCVNSKTRELIFQMHFVTSFSSSEMPDLKAADEVDFRSNGRAGVASAEVAVGGMASAEVAMGEVATTAEMKPGLKTQAVSGIKSVPAQNVFSLVCCV